MDKLIIEAIIELFAIISGKTLNNSIQSNIVSNILSKYLTSDQLAFYLNKFEVQKNKYISELSPSKQARIAVKILKLCNQINTGSNLIGKYTITVKLHEFIKGIVQKTGKKRLIWYLQFSSHFTCQNLILTL